LNQSEFEVRTARGNPQGELVMDDKRGGDDHGAQAIIRHRARSCDCLDFVVDVLNAIVVSNGGDDDNCLCGYCGRIELY
jgi:hypothetical protein